MRLRTALIIPFIVFILISIGITGYISLNNSHRAVNDVATELCREITEHIQLHIENYLSIPHLITQINVDAIQLGLLTLEEPAQLERHFWMQVRNFDSVGNIYIGNSEGGIILAGRDPENELYIKATENFKSGDYLIYAVDESGDRGALMNSAPPYDARKRPWYQAAAEKKQPVWSDIYPFFTGQTLGISASQPIFNAQNELQGVFAIDLFLTQISDFLQGLTVGQSGHTFIIERDGAIVASSSTEALFQDSTDPHLQERVLAINSQERLTRVTAQYLLAKFGGFDEIGQVQQLNFENQGENHFLQVTPLIIDEQIDWLIVVVIPEVDFFAPIYQNQLITILGLIMAACATIFIGLLAVQRITQPILALNHAVQGIARGEWVSVQPNSAVKEVNQLANSFNHMAEQLQVSFSALQHANFELRTYREQLEQTVLERTSELAAMNRQLQKDIVKRKEAEEAANAANRATSIFLANMSHELRTPLNSVLGYTQLLKREQQNAKDNRRLDAIERSGEHLLQLINDVLDIAKVESGKVLLHKTEFHFPAFLQNVCEIAQGAIGDTEIAFRFEVVQGDRIAAQEAVLPVGVYGDEKRLRQVLINLLSNAIKFTEYGEVILRVYVNSDRDDIQFEVIDTGVGIPENKVQSIFEPFEQLHDSSFRADGTGLGLSISQKLVTLMGGRLQVSSQLGKGSRFWFNIPLPPVASFAKPLPSVDNRKIIGLSGKAPTVLIVDDEWDNRAILVELLSSVGIETFEATDGMDGLVQAEASLPDAVISDLVMPRLDGFEMIRKLRQHPKLQELVIIATSASVLEKEENQSLMIGSDVFLPKPINAALIFEQLERLLRVEWLYEETVEEHTVEEHTVELHTVIKDQTSLKIPPAEEIKVLLLLAELGDLEALQTRMTALQKDVKAYRLFFSELRYWLDLAKINKVQRILTSYLEKSTDDTSA